MVTGRRWRTPASPHHSLSRRASFRARFRSGLARNPPGVTASGNTCGPLTPARCLEVLDVFWRIAVVNRGEAAIRLIHAVKDLCAAGQDLVTIALYTDAERLAMFVREADEAYPLGPASARPYLDLKVLERALVETRADAVWVGWGFVAEDPTFVDLCDHLGVTFIGPGAEAMRRLGDKIGAKLLA